MSEEPLDELGARLFEALRSELPPAGAERRVLARARRERAQRAPRRAAQVLLLAAGFALAGAYLARHRQAPSAISAEPSLRLDPGARNHAPAVPPHVEAPASALLADPDPSAPPKARRTPPSPSAPLSATPASALSLEDELLALKTAEGALNQGDASGALKLLDQYDAAKGRLMRAEATVLRIEALSRSGKAADAARLAQSFVDANPGSPLVDRARSFIGQGEAHAP